MIFRLSKDIEDSDGLCHFWFYASTNEYAATVDYQAANGQRTCARWCCEIRSWGL